MLVLGGALYKLSGPEPATGRDGPDGSVLVFVVAVGGTIGGAGGS